MKKKKNMGTCIPCTLIFLGVYDSVMFTVHSLSAEDGQMPSARSEIVTEKTKEQVNTRPKTTEEGVALSGCIKYFTTLHSSYGSDWNANIRKLAHFSIYFTPAAGIRITLTTLGVNKSWRFLLIVGTCFYFAFGDEYHQKFIDHTSSIGDVHLDTFGALVSTCIWAVISVIYSGIHLLVNKAYGGA